MKSIEVEDSTVEGAIERALRALQLGRDEVQVDVLAVGGSGGAARVRVSVPGTAAGRSDVSRETSSEVADRGLQQDAKGVDIEVARTVVLDILGHIGARCEVQIGEPRDGSVVLNLTGDDSALVIGRRGQTLDALEYLVNRILGRDGLTQRVSMDVEAYRERRDESLVQLAHRLAEKVRETGRPVEMDELSSRDRRVVHLALEGSAGVTTRSEGEGRFRRLYIVPDRSIGRPSHRG